MVCLLLPLSNRSSRDFHALDLALFCARSAKNRRGVTHIMQRISDWLNLGNNKKLKAYNSWIAMMGCPKKLVTCDLSESRCLSGAFLYSAVDYCTPVLWAIEWPCAPVSGHKVTRCSRREMADLCENIRIVWHTDNP